MGDKGKTGDKLYHYTDEKGAKGIAESKMIYASKKKNGDALFGEGVYATTVPPETSKAKIYENNYDGMTPIKTEKLDYVMYVVVIAKSDVPNVKNCGSKDRDVYLIPGGDLVLSDKEYEIQKTGEH